MITEMDVYRFIFKQPVPCFRKFHVIEKLHKPCTCFFKCKYPPPGPPIALKIEARPPGSSRVVQYGQ